MKNQSIIPSLQQIINFFSTNPNACLRLNEATIDQISKETGFSKRKRKLPAIVFLGMQTTTPTYGLAFIFGLIQLANAIFIKPKMFMIF